ncbi:NAD(P)-binding protein [Polychaeton citri CBS 116435]|uniref:NAD(P)-binding protein n=1 Tax=Polychaeton citri CBS 116435 TaxID=1314669 RepID=A0A9P4UN31_9PEZI|nr:NAD(P)-binding protein [Polychaeton citri CBS 116435]
MASSTRNLLVTGATGKQGGALVSALLSTPNQPFTIYAVTRNATSASALALAARSSKIKLVEGSFEDVPGIFSQVPGIWGMFLVTTFDKGVKREESQGKALAKGALDAGAKHVVFTATDRGINGDNDPTSVAHFKSKYNVEKEIERLSSQSSQGASWTALRPVAFMDNLTDNFFGRAFVSMWRLNGIDHKLQLISTTDIGKIAAEAFLNYDRPEYHNKAIDIAGDSITPAEAAKVFKEETGKDLPASYSWVGWLLKAGLKEALGDMFNWFAKVGFAADPQSVKQRYPFVKDFRTWVREESAWRK